jgi:hypothetical protein
MLSDCSVLLIQLNPTTFSGAQNQNLFSSPRPDGDSLGVLLLLLPLLLGPPRLLRPVLPRLVDLDLLLTALLAAERHVTSARAERKKNNHTAVSKRFILIPLWRSLTVAVERRRDLK